MLFAQDWHAHAAQRIQQGQSARSGTAAMCPHDLDFGRTLEREVVGQTIDLQQQFGPRACRQLGQPPRNGRQGGVVAAATLDDARCLQKIPCHEKHQAGFARPCRNGQALRQDFTARGLPAGDFHQEIFEMR
ncbi:MAG: hypothetical protein I8H91_08840 [Burkholderiales bacterium]|nr:hypothetical protein [Burkholderiales bacterium]